MFCCWIAAITPGLYPAALLWSTMVVLAPLPQVGCDCVTASMQFWGGACKRLGVGPAPIAIDDLTTDKLVDALDFMRQPEAVEAAKHIAAEIAKVRARLHVGRAR